MNIIDTIAASGGTGLVLIALVVLAWVIPVTRRDDQRADDRDVGDQ